jgi:hypothetical protein
MSWEPMYAKDESKPYQYDWENLKVGDFAFDDSDIGFCSGGLTYGRGILVIDIDESTITTQDSSGTKAKWNKLDRTLMEPPYPYYLGAFQSK